MSSSAPASPPAPSSRTLPPQNGRLEYSGFRTVPAILRRYMAFSAEALTDQQGHLRARVEKGERALCQANAEKTMCDMTVNARADAAAHERLLALAFPKKTTQVSTVLKHLS
jgi:hypothetical protein